jgi:hypothetical protein
MNLMSDDTTREEELTRLKGLPNFRFTKRESGIQLAQAEESVYRWWYEFLRLSHDYWFLCRQSEGRSPQTKDERFAQVYRDFGDVFQVPFRLWWKIRGNRIFKETAAPPKVRALKPNHLELDTRNDRYGRILLEVPLSLTRKRIMRQVGKILDEHEAARPRMRIEATTARYPINPVRYQLHTLQTTHEVFNLYRELVVFPQFTNSRRIALGYEPVDFEVDQYQIGKILHLNRNAEKLIGDEREIARRKNTMRATVGRHLSRAKLLIANVEIGEFPKFDKIETNTARFTLDQIKHRDALTDEWLSRSLFSKKSEDEIDRLVQQNGLPPLSKIWSMCRPSPSVARKKLEQGSKTE